MLDLRCLNPCFIQHFERGEWTVSVSALPYHNVALDEAHEMLINRRLKEIIPRPDEHHAIVLADFVAYQDGVVRCVENHVFKYSLIKKQYAISKVAYTKNMYMKMKTSNVFCSEGHNLRTLFYSQKPVELTPDQISDLMKISREGKKRMFLYIRQYIITPSKEVPQKRKCNKLKTFTKTKTTKKTERSKVSRMSKNLRGLNTFFQKAGHIADKVSAFPLALCTADGGLRDPHKSSFKDALMEYPDFQLMFQTGNSLPMSSDTEVIVDLLSFIHNPPPHSLKTYRDYAEHLWEKVVFKLGFDRNVGRVTLVVDKPGFVPKIRELVHKDRAKKTKFKISTPSDIVDDLALLRGEYFVSALSNPDYKMILVTYLSKYFAKKGMDNLKSSQELIIDSSAFCDGPIEICDSKVSFSKSRQHQQGEADCSLWFHAHVSDKSNILVVGRDTDIYM